MLLIVESKISRSSSTSQWPPSVRERTNLLWLPSDRTAFNRTVLPWTHFSLSSRAQLPQASPTVHINLKLLHKCINRWILVLNQRGPISDPKSVRQTSGLSKAQTLALAPISFKPCSPLSTLNRAMLRPLQATLKPPLIKLEIACRGSETVLAKIILSWYINIVRKILRLKTFKWPKQYLSKSKIAKYSGSMHKISRPKSSLPWEMLSQRPSTTEPPTRMRLWRHSNLLSSSD